MAGWVLLLRGINVGAGRTRVAMPWLRERCTDLGLTGVSTHLNSGNVVASGTATAARAAVGELETALEELTGASIRVLLRSAAQLAAVVALDPFPDADPARVVVQFARQQLTEADLDAARDAPGPAGWVATGTELVLHYPQGLGRLRPKDEPRLRCVVTARNWRTTLALARMVSERD